MVQVGVLVTCVFTSLLLLLLSCVSRASPTSSLTTNHSKERFLSIPQLPYPYYQRPSYRYPYYDKDGYGKLVYGYGGRQLFKYTKFRPIDGYSRR